MEPIWQAWSAGDPRTQARDALEANQSVVDRFASLDPAQVEAFHLDLFGMSVDAVRLAQMRLSELALHIWDVAVALDPSATVIPEAVVVLVDTLGQLAARVGKAEGRDLRLVVETSEPERHFYLEAAETVTLEPRQPGEDLPGLRLPAEAFVRLVYGRLDPAHTPAVEAEGVDLDELRRVFPGI